MLMMNFQTYHELVAHDDRVVSRSTSANLNKYTNIENNIFHFQKYCLFFNAIEQI